VSEQGNVAVDRAQIIDSIVAAGDVHQTQIITQALEAPPIDHTIHAIGAAEDSFAILKAIQHLRALKFEVRYFPSAAGSTLTDEERQSIATAHQVLVFWSPAARRDSHVEATLVFARKVGALRTTTGEAQAAGFLQGESLDGTELPAELDTSFGWPSWTVGLALGLVGAAVVALEQRGSAATGSWALVAGAVALCGFVAAFQVMRRPDRLLRAGAMYGTGDWLGKARVAELLAVAERVLDQIFGTKLISLRSFAVSTALTGLVVIPIVTVWAAYGGYVAFVGGASPEETLGTAWRAAGQSVDLAWRMALANVVLDYVSLTVTRSVLRRLVARPGFARLTLGLVLDAGVVVACALGVLYANTAMAGIWASEPGGWPRLVLTTGAWAVTGRLHLLNAVLDPFTSVILVAAAAVLTSALPSLVHGALLLLAFGNRLAARIPTRVVGDVLRRMADASHGPWTWLLPASVAGLVGSALLVPAPRTVRPLDALTADLWSAPIACPEPCLIGCPDSEEPCYQAEVRREVPAPPPFVMMRTEVTQELWAAVWDAAGAVDEDRYGLARRPSVYAGWDLPVDNVSLCDSARFANLWTALAGSPDGVRYRGVDGSASLAGCEWTGLVVDPAGGGLRLPTEVEWEVAARAGARTAYANGDRVEDLLEVGWVTRNSGWHPHPVGQLAPNANDLYDMHGNVFEWTESPYDPANDSPGAWRVIRGGSFQNVPAGARAAFRDDVGPWFRVANLGFRLVRASAPSR